VTLRLSDCATPELPDTRSDNGSDTGSNTVQRVIRRLRTGSGIIALNAGTVGGPVLWFLAVAITPFGLPALRKPSAA